MSAAPTAGCRTTARPCAWRLRPDLVIERQIQRGRACWLVKDPLTLSYFRFAEEEYALLKLLDGRKSLTEVAAEFARAFPAEAIGVEELQRLIAQVEESGLLVSDSMGQSPRLEENRRRRAAKGRWAGFNPMAIRLPGIDPEPILNWLYPRLQFLFSPLCVAMCLIGMLAAASLVLVQWHEIQARLPTFQRFFTAENAVWLALVLAGMKICHELGHALVARHYGGECHELGVMFLCFMPCLYCNVSDSWMVGSKWKRAGIAAAGMYVEMVLAAGATFLWWFSQPGLVHHLCLNVMFIGGVNTLLFNANPLLRYDGYYIVSDLFEIPNLRQKARDALAGTLSAWMWGGTRAIDPLAPASGGLLFAAFAVASSVYGWVMTLSVLWFLNKVFEPYGLQIVGRLIALLAFSGLIVWPVVRLVRLLFPAARSNSQPRRSAVKPLRVALSCGALAVLAGGGLWFPVSHRIQAGLVMEPHAAQRVYVEAPGVLEQVLVQPGTKVAAGETLAGLSNLELAIGLAELAGKLAEQKAEVEDLERQRFTDPSVTPLLPPAIEAVRDLESRLAKRKADAERLSITAPCGGVVLAPPEVPHRALPEGHLSHWSGRPLEESNLGTYLEPGTLVCMIGDPRELEAVLAIDQSDVEFVRAGQKVEIVLDQQPGVILQGEIAEVAKLDLAVAPRQLSHQAGGQMSTTVDRTGIERPLSTTYQARVRITDESGLLRAGLRGRARVLVGDQTIIERACRAWNQTFHFKL